MPPVSPNIERILLFCEIFVPQSEETAAVTCFILCHFVNCVVDGIKILSLGKFCNTELVLAGTALSFHSLLYVGLGVPYALAEEFSKFCSVLSLLESISLESLCNFRITFAVCLTAHCDIHTDFGALSVEVCVKALKYFRVNTLCNSEFVFGCPNHSLIFLHFHKFVAFCVAKRTLCRSLCSFINISAYETSEFLFHLYLF